MSDNPNDRKVDKDAQERFARLCEMTQEVLDNMSPGERDQMRQRHLAAARGPANNLRLLFQMTDMLLAIRKAGSP